MLYRKISILSKIDWWLVGLYLLFVLTGWFCIHAATYRHVNSHKLSNRATMQILWIISAFCIAFILLVIKTEWHETFAFVFYSIMIFILAITVFVATPIKGSRSWLVFGPFRIQPAEFAKVSTALAIAKVIDLYQLGKILKKWKMFILTVLILVPVMLILLQNETGSALVFFVFFIVLFREGMPGKVLFVGFSSIFLFILVIYYSHNYFSIVPIGELFGFVVIIFSSVVYLFLFNSIRERKRIIYLSYLILFIGITSILAEYLFEFNYYWIVVLFMVSIFSYFLFLFIKLRLAPYLWVCVYMFYACVFIYSTNFIFDNVLEPHQKTRIQVTLGLINDPKGAGYNINQSKIAIGSGRFIGKGYLKGTQTKLKYVPEQETDFIFCTIGEEHGFIGSVIFLTLFTIFIIRLIFLSEKQERRFYRVYGYCVACVLFFHFTINIGMVLGITPVVGIPLPFFSYGGSSLLAFTILLFLFIRADAYRKKCFY